MKNSKPTYAQAAATIAAYDETERAYHEAIIKGREQVIADRLKVTRRRVWEKSGGGKMEVFLDFMHVLEAYERGPEAAPPVEEASVAHALPEAVAKVLTEAHSVLDRAATVFDGSLRTALNSENERTVSLCEARTAAAEKATTEANDRTLDAEGVIELLIEESAGKDTIIAAKDQEIAALKDEIQVLKDQAEVNVGERMGLQCDAVNNRNTADFYKGEVDRMLHAIEAERHAHRTELSRAREEFRSDLYYEQNRIGKLVEALARNSQSVS